MTRHVPELDGLRGVAVLLVLAAHLELLPWGGYTGVTLFFVLSGYLITSLLIAERTSTGRVDLRAFYGRRARRLLPALSLVMLAAAALTILSGRGDRLIGDLAPVALYVSNLARVEGADLGWLPHAWSLSVEEQSYIVWPVVLIVASRWLPLVCLGGIIGGIVVREVAGDGELAYGTLARGDAILYGALLAVVGFRWARLWPLAVLVIVWATLTPALSGPLPVAVALAAVVLVAATPRWLAWAPLVGIGRRSYGIYLWHLLPVLLVRPLLPEPVAIAFVVLVTATAAWASFRWVEQPILQRRFRLSLRAWPSPPVPRSPGPFPMPAPEAPSSV